MLHLSELLDFSGLQNTHGVLTKISSARQMIMIRFRPDLWMSQFSKNELRARLS